MRQRNAKSATAVPPLVNGAAGALTLIAFVYFGIAISLPLLAGRHASTPKPPPTPITPTPSGVTFSAPEVPYTFVLPRGFVPRINAGHDDARLIPEPWLPTQIEIELSREALNQDISTMDAARLRQYARTVVSQEVYEPIDSITTADGSTALQYSDPAEHKLGSLYTMVFHGRTVVIVRTDAGNDANEAQRNTLREATRTLVGSMRFR